MAWKLNRWNVRLFLDVSAGSRYRDFTVVASSRQGAIDAARELAGGSDWASRVVKATASPAPKLSLEATIWKAELNKARS